MNPTGRRTPPDLAAGARMRTWSALLALAFTLAAAPALSQLADPHFPATNGWVYSLAFKGDTLYVGGSFSAIGGVPTGGAAAVDSATAAADPKFPRVLGTVYASLPDRQGGWYIGGLFSSVAGVPRSNLAHLRADGSLDGWNPGTNGRVRCLAAANGRVFAGGDFAQAGGVARKFVAALDSATGAVLPWNPGTSDLVMSLAVRDTTLYLGGAFILAGGATRPYLAAAGVAGGEVLPWNPTIGPYSQYPYVYALAVSGDTVWAGGYFSTVGGVSRPNLAAIHAASGAPLDWAPAPSARVYTLALEQGTLYAGGSFTTIAGVPRSRLAAFDSATGQLLPWDPGADVYVNSLAASGSTVYAAGRFGVVGGAPRRYAAAIDRASGAVRPWVPEPDAEAFSVSAGRGRVLLGGGFFATGQLPRSNLAAIDSRTGEVLPWNPVSASSVVALAVVGPNVFASGAFSGIGGQASTNIAAMDAATGAFRPWVMYANSWINALYALGGNVYVAGPFTEVNGNWRRRLAAFDGGTGALLDWNPVADNEVLALSGQDSTIFAGGRFLYMNNYSQLRVAALHAKGGNKRAWAPEPSNTVSALLADGPLVYVAGDFSMMGLHFVGRICPVNTQTGLVQEWALSGVSDRVRTMAKRDSMLFIGGSFYSVGAVGRQYLAALLVPDGLVLPWDFNSNGDVFALANHGLDLYAGGAFSYLGTRPRRGLARIPDPFGFEPLAVGVLSPAEGNVLVVGQSLDLRWATAGGANGVQSVDLALSRHGPDGPWDLLAAGTADTGRWRWTVTGPVVLDSVFLRVSARDYGGGLVYATNAGAFSIRDDVPPSLGTGGPGEVRAVSLAPVFPNPARSGTRVEFALPRAASVRVGVLDVQGRELAVLADGERAAGRHSLELRPGALPPGLYFVRLRADGAERTRRFVVLR